jgi:hypothetical protein
MASEDHSGQRCRQPQASALAGPFAGATVERDEQDANSGGRSDGGGTHRGSGCDRLLCRELLHHQRGPWVANDLRMRTYHHLQQLSLNYYDKHETGTLLSTITRDV